MVADKPGGNFSNGLEVHPLCAVPIGADLTPMTAHAAVWSFSTIPAMKLEANFQ